MVKKNFSITVNEVVMKRVDVLADDFGVSRSQMIENVLSVGVADAELFKSVGLIDFAKLLIRFQKGLKGGLKRVPHRGKIVMG